MPVLSFIEYKYRTLDACLYFHTR